MGKYKIYYSTHNYNIGSIPLTTTESIFEGVLVLKPNGNVIYKNSCEREILCFIPTNCLIVKID